jgi:hypothetical protein
MVQGQILGAHLIAPLLQHNPLSWNLEISLVLRPKNGIPLQFLLFYPPCPLFSSMLPFVAAINSCSCTTTLGSYTPQ